MPRRTRKEWLTEREAADLLGVRPSLLSTWRKKGLITIHENPHRRGVLYDAQELIRIKQLADRLAQLGIPSPVSAAVRGRVPVRWLSRLLGISRQRIYQLTPGSLTWDHALTLIERRMSQNPALKNIYQTMKRLQTAVAKGVRQRVGRGEPPRASRTRTRRTKVAARTVGKPSQR